MACVTADEVKAIMNGCTMTDSQIDPFIISAHAFIERVLSSDTTVSASLRLELEKWLTAHLIASIYNNSDTNVRREKLGEAEVEYNVQKLGMGFDSTPYGQMLKQLDPTGLLALAGKKAATIYAVKSFEE